MDGGRKKWLAEGKELSTDAAERAEEDLQSQRSPTIRSVRSCPKCRRP